MLSFMCPRPWGGVLVETPWLQPGGGGRWVSGWGESDCCHPYF